ncbi:hypothetical protein Ancab_029235 [Ancistrocladus abbreviatus]
MTDASERTISTDNPFAEIPDDLLIEIFIRVPISDWAQISCVNKQCANLFRREDLWQAALLRTYPFADHRKRWPGPIPQGFSRRRFTALYVSRSILMLDDEIDEILGHMYLFLKEQLEISTVRHSLGILHGIIIDDFIACGKSRDKAYELASHIWLAVIDNLEENHTTFLLLKRLALEGNTADSRSTLLVNSSDVATAHSLWRLMWERRTSHFSPFHDLLPGSPAFEIAYLPWMLKVFLSFPYARSHRVQWRAFEKLFTCFRNRLNNVDSYELLASACSRFGAIPATWLGKELSWFGSVLKKENAFGSKTCDLWKYAVI